MTRRVQTQLTEEQIRHFAETGLIPLGWSQSVFARALAGAYLSQQTENERLRGVHLAAAETPWSFHQGSLRERLEWCRTQHQIHAENPPLHPSTRQAKADFDRACVGWYDEMLRQLDEIEQVYREALDFAARFIRNAFQQEETHVSQDWWIDVLAKIEAAVSVGSPETRETEPPLHEGKT